MTANYRLLPSSFPSKFPQESGEEFKGAVLQPRSDGHKSAGGMKGISLTDRDYRLIEVLGKVRCLGQHQIKQLFDLKGKAYQNRLAKLMKAGYLQKLTFGQKGGVYGIVWAGGRKLKGKVRPFSRTRLSESEHQLGLSQIYIDLIQRTAEAASFIDLEDGLGKAIRFGRVKIVPDAIITRRLNQTGVLYLELDLSTKSLKRVEAQLKHYRDYFMSPNAAGDEQALFITKSTARRNSLHELSKRLSIGHMVGPKIRVVERSAAIDDIARFVGFIDRVRQIDTCSAVNPSKAERMIPREGVQKFIEEAVSMFHQQGLPLPDSYASAAGSLYPR